MLEASLPLMCSLGCPTKTENSVNIRWGNFKMISLLLVLISSAQRSSDAQKPDRQDFNQREISTRR